MAKIRNSKPKQRSGGYTRLVGNPDMADIFTRAQSTVISNGTELEKLISERACTIDNLDDFIGKSKANNVESGAYLCTKKTLKTSHYRLDGHEPDFLAFKVAESEKICYIIELKDGDAFDTKKSRAEKERLDQFANHIGRATVFQAKPYICCFNQLDKSKIVTGVKNEFSTDEVLTGCELCEILGINYNDILSVRKEDISDNFNYVIEKMLGIKEMRDELDRERRTHIGESEFYTQINQQPEEE